MSETEFFIFDDFVARFFVVLVEDLLFVWSFFWSNYQHFGWLKVLLPVMVPANRPKTTPALVPPKSNVAPGAWGKWTTQKCRWCWSRHRKRGAFQIGWSLSEGAILILRKKIIGWIFSRIKTQVAAKTLLCSASLPFRPKAAAHPGGCHRR